MTKEEWIVNAKGSLDLPGSLLYALAMIAIMVGLSEVMTLAYAKYLLAAGLLLFLAFLYGEWHRKSPVLPVRIFAGNRVFSCSSLAAMLNYCATFGISFLLSIYLQRITGLNARDTGLVLLIQPVLMALLSPVTGALSDRINPAVLASSGMILITFGLCLLAVDVSYPFFWLIALALVIIGIGFALFTAPNNNAIMGAVTPKYYGPPHRSGPQCGYHHPDSVAKRGLGCLGLAGPAHPAGLHRLYDSLCHRHRPFSCTE